MSYLRLFATIGLSLLLASCASVSVGGVERLSRPLPTRVPDTVFVMPFTFTESRVRVDRGGSDLRAFEADLRDRMTKNLRECLGEFVPHVQEVLPTAPLPAGNNWLITGNFDRVNQGSRVLRALVGLGAGGTKMETTVIAYDLSGSAVRPFLRIHTTGGSNISPGVGGVATFFVSGPMALTNVFNVVDGVRSGVSFDGMRTSREIAAVISEFLVQQGALPREKAIGPKRKGRDLNRLEVAGGDGTSAIEGR
jgi:hypothetical protein